MGRRRRERARPSSSSSALCSALCLRLGGRESELLVRRISARRFLSSFRLLVTRVGVQDATGSFLFCSCSAVRRTVWIWDRISVGGGFTQLGSRRCCCCCFYASFLNLLLSEKRTKSTRWIRGCASWAQTGDGNADFVVSFPVDIAVQHGERRLHHPHR